MRTLADLPFHVSGRFPKPLLIRRCTSRGFDDLSSREFFERIRDLSLGLSSLGVEAGDRVAIMAESRPEWIVADLAILAAGSITVPIYPTLSALQAAFILADSGARVLITSNMTHTEKIRQVRSGLPALGHVIVMDPSEPAPSGELALAAVIERGRRRLMAEQGLARVFREQVAGRRPDDLATIIYTSGTTGDPKGVMLTHANILANLVDVDAVLAVTDEDVALSFLPLSHALERTVLYLYLFKGVTVAFAESLETISRDLPAVRPTIMTGVPRVYEKLYERARQSALDGGALRARIFAWALGVGRARARARLEGRRPGPLLELADRLADRLVFARVRARTGGRLRMVVSGSAPLSTEVGEFLFACGLPVVEGYGLTETAPVLTVNPLAAPRLGTVGKALPSVELRLADDGEILVRGPNVMRGYYNRPDETSRALRDGWLATGDIGRLDADGYLTITDRKKELIITAGGKNVAPQPIEARLKGDPLVAEAVLVGDRRKFIGALIVPNFEALDARLRQLGRLDGSRDELVRRPDVVALYAGVVDAVNAQLASFEQIKRFALVPAEFSIAGGELTPTLKVRRRVVEEKWKEEIEQLYSQDRL